MSAHTPGPWRKGKTCDSIVASEPGLQSEYETEYYGGRLVAESVDSGNRPLIMVAPELLAAVEHFYKLAGDRMSVFEQVEIRELIARAKGEQP